ncbi:putative RNA-directed DNA polymerase, eukaryota, reverse transcriptase zinc-binding domain protein, partial [Tanacetum coccineum]
MEGIKEVVSDNQSAFIPGRRISDNILITQELMHNYHRNRGPPRCAFKIENQKAYDTVDWKFLENILININGNIHGFFKGKRALRQGDPLSPYLFTLVMEILTLILKRRVRLSKFFRYHRYCEEVELINVCFADDLFIFVRGDVESSRVIMDSLEKFKLTLGLIPSIPKSTAYFCNVLDHTKMAILSIMPFSEGDLPAKYLGVPLISSGLLNRDGKILVGKAKNRIGDCLLREAFNFCNSELKRGKAKIAWEDICLPKCEGGLGLHNLEVFNYALMTTHIWNIISSKDSLWVRWIHTYKLRGRTTWDVPVKDEMSWVWHITREGFQITSTVADLVSNGAWSWPQSWLLKASNLGLITCPALISSKFDLWQWRDQNGNVSMFSVAKSWDAIRPRGNQVVWSRIVWFSHNIPRHAFHLWLVMRNGLKTHDKMRQWDVGGDTNLNLLRANERPPMFEKGNYIPWESRFRRFLDNKLEDGEWMWNSIQNGPYQRPMIPNPD